MRRATPSLPAGGPETSLKLHKLYAWYGVCDVTRTAAFVSKICVSRPMPEEKPMKTIGSLFILSALVVVVRADDAAKVSLVGVWEVVKSDEAPKGSTVTFTKDGKLILITDAKKLEATYKLEGKKLTT